MQSPEITFPREFGCDVIKEEEPYPVTRGDQRKLYRGDRVSGGCRHKCIPPPLPSYPHAVLLGPAGRMKGELPHFCWHGPKSLRKRSRLQRRIDAGAPRRYTVPFNGFIFWCWKKLKAGLCKIDTFERLRRMFFRSGNCGKSFRAVEITANRFWYGLQEPYFHGLLTFYVWGCVWFDGYWVCNFDLFKETFYRENAKWS